jgi:hypothetical protein
MSLSFANAVVTGLQAHGITVKYHAGWQNAGNGQVSAYQGMSWHHTATAFGEAPAVLWEGRPDLDGPLCNSAGNSDGSVTIISANPANHAGASGGKKTAPLPITTLFNKMMWGHEIVYPGTVPMTAAQYRTALILGGVIMGILGHPTAEWCKGHSDTSITGKWDPGTTGSKAMDTDKMRADVWPALFTEDTDVPLSDADRKAIAKAVWEYMVPNKFPDKQPAEMGDMLSWADVRLYDIHGWAEGMYPQVVTKVSNRAGANNTVDPKGGSDSLLGFAANAAGTATRIESLLRANTPAKLSSVPDTDLAGLAEAVCDEMDRRTLERLDPPKGK